MSKLKLYFQKIRHSPSAVALIFSLCLAMIEAYAFQQDYTGFFRTLTLGSLNSARELFFVCFAFTGLFFFVRSTIVSSFRWQCVYFAVFALALSVEYGFYNALHRFTLPSDVENTFYASDTSDKFGAITLFFSWLVIAPLTIFRLLFWFSPKKADYKAKLFAFNLVFLLAGFSLLSDFYRRTLPTNAFAAHLNNLVVSALYFGKTKFRSQKRQPVTRIESAPGNNIVFIVDESVRADHLSINGYERKTTPTLESLEKQNLLRNWGLSVSGATESVGSNRLLLSGLTDLPDREGKIRSLPTIFQYARATGYKTFYFDGQGYADWIGDKEDRTEFGQIFTSQDFPENLALYDLDRAFAEKIREIVGNSTGNFIWVNKRGVHFRYEKNYPAEKIIWASTDLKVDAAPQAEETTRSLVDNYDNAIFYNSESFFQPLVGDKLPPATVFVYTSDHGQTLLPDCAPHAGDSKTEALVPIFIIGADERLQHAEINFAAGHRNLFATLLDLMNYPKQLYAHDYAESLLKVKAVDSQPRTYFVGNLSGAFGGKKMLFDKIEK